MVLATAYVVALSLCLLTKLPAQLQRKPGGQATVHSYLCPEKFTIPSLQYLGSLVLKNESFPVVSGAKLCIRFFHSSALKASGLETKRECLGYLPI